MWVTPGRVPRGVILLSVCVLLAACDQPSSNTGAARSAADDEKVEHFLERHWARPLAPQGVAPAGSSPLEAALDPESCGRCHVRQFEDWKTALHAKAMGPGVLGQLLDMAPASRDQHQECLRCHAPLAEQAASLLEALKLPESGRKHVLAHEQGLTCAGCHVRNHERFGPPRRDGSAPAGTDARLPHGGWTAAAAFEDPRFCSACHQFGEGDFALNGKYLENTFEEWKASRYAREGRSCQSCHMPDRRHLWRGIHDEQMVRSGVTISVVPPSVAGGAIEAALEIRNTGTGHRFPTYVTPKVVAEIYQIDAEGRALPKTLRQIVIARLVEPDLSAEIADTRLAPDESVTLAYRVPANPRAVVLAFRVRVEPEAFYTDFFESLLSGGGIVRGRGMIQVALENSRRSRFTLYEEQARLWAPNQSK